MERRVATTEKKNNRNGEEIRGKEEEKEKEKEKGRKEPTGSGE